ncbi:hypothetical protein CEXT_529281 [Caerostris extrusa]|uniref:Uncharacterized protein n=1 Tax=Caerostris extrusa TaxID=172846 RepID=A0AAV4S8A5_CAEEX|nr:hypothetical protein CEXT_529281 [Caerostris extrusa]
MGTRNLIQQNFFLQDSVLEYRLQSQPLVALAAGRAGLMATAPRGLKLVAGLQCHHFWESAIEALCSFTAFWVTWKRHEGLIGVIIEHSSTSSVPVIGAKCCSSGSETQLMEKDMLRRFASGTLECRFSCINSVEEALASPKGGL